MPIPSRGQICFAQLFSEHPDKQDYFLCSNVFTPTDSALEEGDCVAVISFGNKTNERTNERTNPFQEILLKHFFLSCFYSSAGVLLSSVWRSVTNELLLKMFFLWNFKILYFFLFSSESPGCHLREIVRCASSKENQRWAKKKNLKNFFRGFSVKLCFQFQLYLNV